MKRLSVLILSLFCFSQADAQAFISNRVQEKLAEKGKVPCLLVFSPADVSAAKDLKGKEAKAQYVYQTLQSHAQATQKNVLSLLGSTNHQSFWATNAIKVECDAAMLKMLAAQPEVKEILYDAPLVQQQIQPTPANARTSTSSNWGIATIQADKVWAMGIKGQGVVVGGQDTGYDWQHPAIQNQYRGWDGTNADHNYNWHDAIHALDVHNNGNPNPCGLDLLYPCDDQQHGTHTMGTMAGSVVTDSFGVAPAARWIGVRNMENGWGMTSTYIEAFQWFIAPTDLTNQHPDPSKAPHVINNSWGCPPSEGCDASNFGLMENVVNNVKASGVVVVVSNGNDGWGGCGSTYNPAAIFENSFSVGATDPIDDIAGFSSRGPVTVDGSGRMKPNVSAPGVGIYSCVPNGGYSNFSGTSMAGPHVAGVVALVICANPSLAGDVEAIETIIENTSLPLYSNDSCGGDLPTSLPNNKFGHGRVNALTAVQAAINVSNTKPVVNTVSVFPNPTSSLITVQIPSKLTSAQFECFDMQGKKVMEETLTNTSTEISVSSLAKGIYSWKITQAQTLLHGKFVKQ